jgi:hypothetical protein
MMRIVLFGLVILLSNHDFTFIKKFETNNLAIMHDCENDNIIDMYHITSYSLLRLKWLILVIS